MKELNLKSVVWHFEETKLPIGDESELLPYKELLMKCHPTYTFVVTTNCEELVSTICDRLLLNELVKYSGAKLEQASQDVPGMKPGLTRILKIPALSGGAVTQVRFMLLLMNFAEV